MAEDSSRSDRPEKQHHSRSKPLSLAPLTFEQALDILAPTVRAPRAETTPAPTQPRPAKQKRARASKAKRAHKRYQ